MENKHTLYLVGGTARAGKSTVASRMARADLISLPTDFVRSIIRNALVGNAPINVGKFNFEGIASYGENQSWPIKVDNLSEDELAWRCVRSMIHNYDVANKHDILFEGVAITPQEVNALQLNNLVLKVVFLGYNNESHADNIITHAKEAHDYIYGEMLRSGKGENYVRENIAGDINRSHEIKEQAERFGYRYFDVTQASSFEHHIQAALNYLQKYER
jgi:2-phosphoglycerate kinase